VAGYRRLELSLQPLAIECLKDLGRHVKSGSTKRIVRSASIKPKMPKRKTPARAR
jgi:hypothetical protein